MTFHRRNTRFITARRSLDNIATGFRDATLSSKTWRLALSLLSSYVLCFILLDNRRHQRKRRGVTWCIERLLIGEPPVGAAEDQHLKEASRRPFELASLLRDSSP